MGEAFYGFVGVLVGSVISILGPWISEWRNNKRKAKYSAARLVCQLDEYAVNCSRVASMRAPPAGQPFDMNVPLPKIYSDDIEWSLLESKFAFESLSLPNVARQSAMSIDCEINTHQPRYYREIIEKIQENSFKIGYLAIGLSKDLRKFYDLPEEDTFPSQMEEFFNQMLDAIKKNREKREANEG